MSNKSLKNMVVVATAFMALSVSAVAAAGNNDVEKMFPRLAKNTLTTLQAQAPIQVNVNTDMDDGAQAAREYADYSQTKSCTISVNPGHYIFQDEVNPFTRIGLSIPTIQNMILLHEMAHCVDGEPAPAGVDAVAWREALADGFAVSMLYHNYEISSPKVGRLSLFRNSNENGGAHKMLNFMADNMERYGDKNVDPMIVLNKVKELRKKAFGVPAEDTATLQARL